MTGGIKDWFQALSQREKILVSILGVLIVLIGGYYGIVRPFAGAMERAETEYVEAIERQASIEAKVAALNAPRDEEMVVISGPVETYVSQSAGEAGFAVGSLAADGDNQVNITIDSAKPTALFRWLAELEARGVSVADMDIRPSAESTISATITLRAPS